MHEDPRGWNVTNRKLPTGPVLSHEMIVASGPDHVDKVVNGRLVHTRHYYFK